MIAPRCRSHHPAAHRTLALCLVLLLFAYPLRAANLIRENASFETGRWGFDAVPVAWVRSWPQVVQPRVVVDESAPHGRHALRLDNGSGHDVVAVEFPAMEIPGPSPLTISFWGRSADTATPVTVTLRCGGSKLLTQTVTLDHVWRRRSIVTRVGVDLARETRNQGRAGWYSFSVKVGDPLFHSVWLDAFQVERAAAAGNFAPARPLDAALDLADPATRRVRVYDTGETPLAELRLASACAGTFQADWRLRDLLHGQVLAGGRLEGPTDTQGCACVSFALPAVARRLYRVEATVTVGGATAMAQRVYGGIVNRSKLPGGRFGGSIESFEEGVKLPPPDPSYRLTHWREAPEVYAALARRLGWSWIHLYRQSSPLAIMPAPGEYRFEDCDAVVDLLRRHDLEVVALLTSHGNFNTTDNFPGWMLTGPLGQGGTSPTRGRGVPLPDLTAWEAWCGAMAAHYRGRVAAWEIWNEPGVKMRPGEYLPYARAAWRAIKAADPQATVLGLCGTWDVGGDLYGWVKGCLALGAADTMDAIAIHGYHTRDRDYVARVRLLARERGGRDFPVWDTESGFRISNPYDIPCSVAAVGYLPSSAAAPAAAAENLVRHSVNELAAGVTRLSYFNLTVPWTTLDKHSYALLNYDGSPDMALIAENFLIETFQDATPYASGCPTNEVVTYVFERPAGSLLIYWSETRRGRLRLPLTAPGTLTDLLGGSLEVASSEGEIGLPLDSQPRFYFLRDCAAAELATAVQRVNTPP